MEEKIRYVYIVTCGGEVDKIFGDYQKALEYLYLQYPEEVHSDICANIDGGYKYDGWFIDEVPLL